MTKVKKSGIFRQVFSYMWSDPWFETLELDEKLLFVYLVTNSHSSISGIYEITKRVIAFETGIPEERVVEILQAMEVDGRVLYDDAESIVWVVNMRSYQCNNSPKQIKRAEDDVMLIPNCKVKELYLNYYYGEGFIEPQPPKPQPKAKQIVSPLVEANKATDFMEAIDVFTEVTGFTAFPSTSMESDIYRIGQIVKVHGAKAAEYLKPFWNEWNSRKYSKTNTAWLDWAIVGEASKSKKAEAANPVKKYSLPDDYVEDVEDVEEDDEQEVDTKWSMFIQQHVRDRRWQNLLEYKGMVDGKAVIHVPDVVMEEAQARFGKTLDTYYFGDVIMEGVPA